jgi:hypothetical protein
MRPRSVPESAGETVQDRPLLDKLGVKPGQRISITGLEDPASLVSLLRERTDDVVTGRPRPGSDLLFWPARQRGDLEQLRDLRRYIKDSGAIWVLRAKGTGRTVTETDIINAARAAGLVDNKIASFSDTESAMRLVVPLNLRRPAAPGGN